jgi:glutathione synthase/RimK-type ligase-like ATP-grasp enzyme
MINLYVVYDLQRWQKNQTFYSMIVESGKQYEINCHLLMVEMIDKWELDPTAIVWMRCVSDLALQRFLTLGMIVYNQPELIKLANHKGLTNQFVKALRIPTIPNWVDGFPCIAKAVDGHGGQEVYLVENAKQLENYQSPKYIIQPFIEHQGDIRVYIVGNKIVHSVFRTPKVGEFRSNFSLGGLVTAVEPDGELKSLVETILAALPMAYAGIDFLVTKDGYMFNEIEDVVGARMLYATTTLDILAIWMKYLKETVNVQESRHLRG